MPKIYQPSATRAKGGLAYLSKKSLEGSGLKVGDAIVLTFKEGEITLIKEMLQPLRRR